MSSSPSLSASAAATRQFERKQIKQQYDGAKTGGLFRAASDKGVADPVSRRQIGLKIAGGVRIDVYVRARPPSQAELDAGESVVVKVNPAKASVSMKYVPFRLAGRRWAVGKISCLDADGRLTTWPFSSLRTGTMALL